MTATAGVRGGLRLDAHKPRSTMQRLRGGPRAQTLVLPLDQHAGLPAAPIVKEGQRVLRAQPIAEPAGDLSAWLHAPVSGTVVAIGPRPAPHHIGAPSLSIVLSNDGRDEPFQGESTGRTFEQMAPRELRDHIGRGGIVGLGGGVFPTAPKLAGSHDAPRLLLNGVECEPYISCDDMLMRERARDVVFGARVLMHAVEAPSCAIAIEDDLPQAAAALREALGDALDERIRLHVVRNVYPAGGEKQLITALFGVGTL